MLKSLLKYLYEIDRNKGRRLGKFFVVSSLCGDPVFQRECGNQSGTPINGIHKRRIYVWSGTKIVKIYVHMQCPESKFSRIFQLGK